jgi:NAD(P)-dependent dehydrogenase (short-subunit alcohol dehydrogenase family)
VFEASGHGRAAEDGHRDGSFAGDRRGDCESAGRTGFQRYCQFQEGDPIRRDRGLRAWPWWTATSARRQPPPGSSWRRCPAVGSIDALVNNAGIFFTKPFTDYTADDFKSLISTNADGFLYVTQLSIRQMLARKTGGSIVTIRAALARNPILGVTAAAMVTKGGLETITQHLAMEYAKDGIRVNAVAPGPVYTPLHRDTPKTEPKARPQPVRAEREKTFGNGV